MTAKVTREDFEARCSPEPNTGCWVWFGPTAPNGYGTHGSEKAHRVSYRLHKGEIPKGLWVLHSCDNRWCVSPDHLRLGTRQDNIDDMTRRQRNRGSKGRGSANPAAKLTESDVMTIKRRLRCGETHGRIANDFGVNRYAVWRIASGKGWRSVVAGDDLVEEWR